MQRLPAGWLSVHPFTKITSFSSNIPFASDDFSQEIPGGDPLFVNAAAGNFFPAPFAVSIDSSVDTLPDRDDFKAIRSGVGLTTSPILAPDRDATGQLRVDDPEVDTPSGQGANVFKDRGSLDRSDFVGPFATLVLPQDNDAEGNDLDVAVSTVQVSEGVFPNFTLQITDGLGSGVADDTVDGRTVTINEDGVELTVRGPAVTVFQDGVFLKEGIDYTFRYNETSNTIVLTPLAGIWSDDKVYQISLNNRDRFVIDADSADLITDSEFFRLTNDNGETGTFEFNSGFTLQVSPTLGIQVPEEGAADEGIEDGQRFSILEDSGRTDVTFEFDRNGNVLSGNVRVPFETGDTADEIATNIVNAVAQSVANGQLTRLTSRNLGDGQVHFAATEDHEVQTDLSVLIPTVIQFPVSLIVPAGGVADIADNEPFTIATTDVPSSLTTTLLFEFDTNASGSTLAGSNVVSLAATATVDDVADAIVAALSNPGLNVGLRPRNAGNGVVDLGAIEADERLISRHSLDLSMSSLDRSLFIGGVSDGEILVVDDDAEGPHSPISYEFDRDGISLPETPFHKVISFNISNSQFVLADKLVDAIRFNQPILDPINVGNGAVNLDSGAPIHEVDPRRSPNLMLSGHPGARPSSTVLLPAVIAVQVPVGGAAAITDGEMFSITDQAQVQLPPAVFEFDKDGVFVDQDNDLVPDNQLIRLNGTESRSEVAEAVQTAISSANLGLSPTTMPEGLVLLGLGPNQTIELFSNSTLQRADRIGTLLDGETIIINDGIETITFEFEDISGINGGNGVIQGNEPIFFDPEEALDNLAVRLADVIRGTKLGLNPANEGSGRVELHDQPRHIVELPVGTNLALLGVPGGSNAIRLRANATDDEVAQAIVLAINNAAAASSFEFPGATATYRGGSTLFVDMADPFNDPADFHTGTASIQGTKSFFLEAIKDESGNPLNANQATDETLFRLLLPGVQLDFGDAPDPFSGAGRYPTLFTNDGARHVITVNPLHLGSSVDADSDGQPSRPADGDDADHLLDLTGTTLVSTGLPPYTIQVPSNGGVGLADGQTLKILRRDIGVERTFEFNSAGTVNNPAHTEIAFNTGDTADEIAANIAAAVEAESVLALQPESLGGGRVFLGGTPRHSVNTAQSSITQFGTPAVTLQIPAGGGAVLRNGESIVFDDGLNAMTFEFRDDLSGIGIAFTEFDSPNEIVEALINAVSASGLNITLTNLGAGRLHVLGESSHDLDVSGSNLSAAARTPLQIQSPGAGLSMRIAPQLQIIVPAAGGAGLGDGEGFFVDDGINPILDFEFDTGNGTNSAAQPVPFLVGDTSSQVADSIVSSIQAALAAGRLTDLTPFSSAPGVVDLGANAIHSLDTSGSALTQVGFRGRRKQFHRRRRWCWSESSSNV